MALDLQRGDVTVGETAADRNAGSPHPDAGARGAGHDVDGLALLRRGHRRPDLRASQLRDLRLLPARRRAASEGPRGRSPPHRRRRAAARRLDPVAAGVRAVADGGRAASRQRQPARRAVVAVCRVGTAAARHDVRAPRSGQRQSAPAWSRPKVGQPGRPEGRVHRRLPARRRRQPHRRQLSREADARAGRHQRQRAARLPRRRGRRAGHLHAAVWRRGFGGAPRQRRARGQRLEDGRRNAGARRSHHRPDARGGEAAARGPRAARRRATRSPRTWSSTPRRRPPSRRPR